MRKKYDKDFKLMMMKLLESGQKASKLSEEYDVNVQMIYRWKREYKNTNRPAFTGNGNIALTPEQEEIARLKKELKEAQMERDILKKAVSIFSKNDKKSSF
ncbi:MAG: transposase [Cytophagales bacterium]|nr:transposase [Cytophagales bacterium]